MTVLGDGARKGMLSLLLPVAKLNPRLYIVNMANKVRGGTSSACWVAMLPGGAATFGAGQELLRTEFARVLQKAFSLHSLNEA